MLQKHFALIVCPVCSHKPELQILSEGERIYDGGKIREINEAIIFSACGFFFPVVDGIPRLQVEAVYDYSTFLQKNMNDYELRLKNLTQKQNALLQYCVKKNKRSKASFEMEWGFLQPEKKDRLWAGSQSDLPKVFLDECRFTPNEVKSRLTLDAGCGHGLTTTAIAGLTGMAVGMELSRAVDDAYKRNSNSNIFFVQADVQYPPFAEATFDILYSSGVIHHTNSTRDTLNRIISLVKSKGRICLWLYHPQDKPLHHFSLRLRKIFSRMPLRLAAVLITVFLFPVSFAYKKIRGKKDLNYREELINLFDAFTPEFREEIPHDTAEGWLKQSSCKGIKITTTDQFGFSIIGDLP
jgi:SAM-dependent methyltransferase/uncharacterized protein YbaR (Trm112 family)